MLLRAHNQFINQVKNFMHKVLSCLYLLLSYFELYEKYASTTFSNITIIILENVVVAYFSYFAIQFGMMCSILHMEVLCLISESHLQNSIRRK